MRLNEIKSNPDGTYAGVRFSPKTRDALSKYTTDNNIPHALDPNKLHTTLLYSRRHLPNYQPAGRYDPLLSGTPTHLEKWPSQPDENGNVSMCLVLRYDCPELVDRHHDLMDNHEAIFDFSEFKPHITLSYDVGGLKCADLPPFEEELEIAEEYGEDL